MNNFFSELFENFHANIYSSHIYNFVICIILFSLFTNICAQYDKTKIDKISAEATCTRININNISTSIWNNGIADMAVNYDGDFLYPKNLRKSGIYRSGFIWGAINNGQIEIGGSSFDTGLQPGSILDGGIPENPNDPKVRVYRVRKDFRTADLSMESIDESKSVSEVYNQYEKDWNEWPWQSGAPYEDINGNNQYDPAIDLPGVPGADQTLWFVANDLDSTLTREYYGSPVMGMEMQTTVWAYKDMPEFNNIIFKKYKVINKGSNNFNDMYFGIWADPDMGDASDDFVGCDTTLNLGYVYNSDSYDPVYGNLNPPSIGFCLLLGPVVDGLPDDKAVVNDRIIKGKKIFQ